jgi:hypothetical protein
MDKLDNTEQEMLLRALQLEAKGFSLKEIQAILSFEFPETDKGSLN